MTLLLATADPEMLLQRASTLIDGGRTGAARPLLAALRGQIPEAAMSRLAARLMLREGRLEEAGAELDAALITAPEDATLLKQRAQMRLQLNDIGGAARDAAEAVIFTRHDAEAKALLGVALTRLDRAGDAVKCLGEALDAEPDNAAFRIALARAYQKSGAPISAIDLLADGVEAAPYRQDIQEELILALVRHGHLQRAVDAAEAARSYGALGACGFGLLGHALSSMNRHSEAADAYREAYKLAPEDPYVRHMVAALGDLPSGKRAPPAYLRAVFDGYADRFEQHLIALGYRVPGLLRGLLLETGDPTFAPFLDLGCGTGLMALVLSDLPVTPMTGVDLSRRMLSHAAAKNLYGELIETDLMRFLAETGARWQTMIAADVFCYMGPLDDALSVVSARLIPGGRCLFTVELLSPQPDGRAYQLQPSARFAHTQEHVQEAVKVAGLIIEKIRFEVLRSDFGEPVQGLLVSAIRPMGA